MTIPVLPEEFVSRMKELLGTEFSSFFQSYSQTPRHGLRVNTLKVSPEEFVRLSPFRLEPVPWCPIGFQYDANERPGKHPYHSAGLYYIQEPSAMAAAEALDAQPGERILDLCAAPGGKTTHIASAMRGEGLLIANEPHVARVKALSENVERMGIRNAIVLNETPERLAEQFPAFFDRILVDAPCSGEGMFRKLPEAVDDWSPSKVTECHQIQKGILDAAARMLKPDGTLVYSTCTFAPLENEQTIEDFLQNHPTFYLESLSRAEWFAPGRPEWSRKQRPDLGKTARLWPHLLEGEGHFLAKLVKTDDPEEGAAVRRSKNRSKMNSALKEAVQAWHSFAHENLPEMTNAADDASFQLYGEQLYVSPLPGFDWSGIKVTRAGWHLGTVKKNRFEPSHALALALVPGASVRTISLSPEDEQILRYLKGETLAHTGEAGWTVVSVNGFPLGWGKASGGQLKNHYPKGLRWV